MGFALPYEAAVGAARKRAPNPGELENIRRLLQAWLDNQAALVRARLKGSGYLDRCIERDRRKINDWLSGQKTHAGTGLPAEKTSSR